MGPRTSSRCFHAVLVVATMFCVLPVPLLAHCPIPDIKVNGEFFQATAVFTGKVMSVRKVIDKGDQEGGWFYKLRVGDVFRGPTAHEVAVFTGDDSNRFPLESGQEYLLFAYQSHGRLRINACGNSALLSEAHDSVQTLNSLLRGKLLTEIDGYILTEDKDADLSGIAVTIQGSSKTYSVTTGKDGRFRIQVPPGKYRVEVVSRTYSGTDTDIFWYDPRGFSLHSGECASLELLY